MPGAGKLRDPAVLEPHRGDFTIISGLHHPDVRDQHASDKSFFTGAPHPIAPSFRNTISLDQLAAEIVDRDKLDQYFTSVRDLETRMVRMEDDARLPKPKPEGPPIKDPGPGEATVKFGLMVDVARLAVQTDLTRIVTLYFVGTAKTPSQPGALFAYHNLSHHGQEAGKIEKLAVLERDLLAEWGTFLGRLKESQERSGEWHDLVIEVRGRTITATIDGKQVLTYQTNAGDAPKRTVQLAVGNGSREVMDGWCDDVRFEPLVTAQ